MSIDVAIRFATEKKEAADETSYFRALWNVALLWHFCDRRAGAESSCMLLDYRD
jgi:hypothetical protein